MNKLKLLLSLVFMVYASVAYSQFYQDRLEICEFLYEDGEYKKALDYANKLVKQLEGRKEATEKDAIPRVLMHKAKYLLALSLYPEFEATVEQALALKIERGENSLVYGLGLLDASYLYLAYTDIVKAEKYLNMAKNILSNRASTGVGGQSEQQDLYFDSQMLYIEAVINLKRGYFDAVDRILPKLKEVREQRISTREMFFDEVTGQFATRRVTARPLRTRKRDYALVLTLEGVMARERGQYGKADTAFRAAEDWIQQKINRTGIDLATVRNTNEWVKMAMELGEDPKDIRDLLEKNLFRADRTSGLIHEAYLETHRLLIQYYFDNAYRTRNKKQMWELKTNTKRYYTDESLPFGTYEKLDAIRRFYGRSAAIVWLLGTKKDQESQLDKAGEGLRELLADMGKIPLNHEEHLEILGHLYLVAKSLNQADSATKYMGEILEAKARIYGDESLPYHLSKIEQADYLMTFTSDFDKVRAILDESFHQVIETRLEPESFKYINTLDEYARYYSIIGKFDSARYMAEKAVKLTAQQVGTSHPLYAHAVERLVELDMNQGEYATANANLDSVLGIYEEVYEIHSPYSSGYASALRTASKYYTNIGLFSEAKLALNRSEKYLRRADASKVSVTSEEERANLLIQTEKLKQAERIVLDMIATKEAQFGADSRFLIVPYTQYANILAIDGNYIEAETYADKAYGLSIKAYGEESFKTVEALTTRANIYTSLGSYDKAEEDIKKVISINERTFGKNHIQLANPYMELGLLNYYKDPSKVLDAEALIQQSLGIVEKAMGINTPAYALGLQTLARVQIAGQKYAEAERNLNQAAAIWLEKLGSTNNTQSASIQLLLGDLELQRGQFSEAIIAYDKAKLAYKKLFNKQHPSYVQSLGKLARGYYMKKQYGKSLDYIQEALENHYRVIEDFFPAMSDGERTRFWQTIRPDFEFFNTLAVTAGKTKNSLLVEMYNNSMNSKGILLSSAIKVRSVIESSQDTMLIATYQRWELLKSQLLEQQGMNPDQLKEEGLDPKKTQKEVDELEKQLSQLSQVFTKSQEEALVESKDIYKSLRKGEVAVEIIRFRLFDRIFTDSVMYAALVISPKKAQPTLVLIPNGKDMESKYLQYYRSCIEYQIEDTYSYEHFWRPIDQAVEEGSKIFLSGDGVFNQINLEAVLNDNGEYVLDHSNIALVSSHKDLYEARILGKQQNLMNNSRVVLFGNPAYYKDMPDEEINTQNSRAIPQLVGSQEEVLSIQEELQEGGNTETKLSINRQATEEEVKKAVNNPAVLHFATHGYFIADSEGNGGSGDLAMRTAINPMLRSGLLLANAGDLMASGNVHEFNREPGVLTAYEASSLKLDGTFVMLSACETARGDVQVGEGVYGLQRALIVAGADGIGMSLFKVSDEATKELMKYFYKFWLIDKMNKREAFIEAKKALRKDYPEPVYWGSFVMIGAID